MNSRERVELFDNKHPLNDAERIALLEMLDDHAAEQRQMCGEAVLNEYNRREPRATGQTLVDACLNATGESESDEHKR